jgi:hypothetical protein
MKVGAQELRDEVSERIISSDGLFWGGSVCFGWTYISSRGEMKMSLSEIIFNSASAQCPGF